MRKRLAAVLALVVATAAALAATAVAGTESASSTQAVSCKSTFTLPLLTPLTGGGGFIGTEQVTWGKYAVKTLASQYGLKVKFVAGDTPVEKGPGEVLAILAEVHLGSECGRHDRPVHVGRRRIREQGTGCGRYRAHLTVRDPHVTDQGRQSGGDEVVLPRHPRGLHPGSDGRELHGRQARREEGRDHRLPGAVLGRPGRCSGEGAQGEGRQHDAALDLGDHDRLLVARDEGAERCGHRVLPATAGCGRADVRSAAARAGQEGEDVRRRRQQQSERVQDRRCVCLQLRAGHQRRRGQQGDRSTVGRRTIRRPRWAPSDRRPISPYRSRLNAITRACKAGKGRSRSAATSSSRSRRSTSRQTILGTPFRFSTKSNDPLNGNFYVFQIQSNGDVQARRLTAKLIDGTRAARRCRAARRFRPPGAVTAATRGAGRSRVGTLTARQTRALTWTRSSSSRSTGSRSAASTH